MFYALNDGGYGLVLTACSWRAGRRVQLIYLNSSAQCFPTPEIRPYLDKYVRGSDGVEAVDRVKLMKLHRGRTVPDLITNDDISLFLRRAPPVVA